MKTKLRNKLTIFCLSVMAVLFAIVGLVGFGLDSKATSVSAASQSYFGGGTGTREDPFIVSSVSHFNAITLRLDAYFVQTANIDFSGEQFYPVGDLTYPFTGHYDGQQFLLSGIQANGGDNIGVFSFVYNGGGVENVRLTTLFLMAQQMLGLL